MSNMQHYEMFINGKSVRGSTGGEIEIEHPADESVFATVPEGTPEDAEAALLSARKAQPAWAALPPIRRAEAVAKLAAAVTSNADKLARIVVMEQGKPLNEAHGEIAATAMFLSYAAEHARRIEGDILPSDNRNEEVWIRRAPYGVVVGLTAWNYPAALTARKLGPALVAGNTFVLKAHEFTPLSGLELAMLASEAGMPPGVFNVVTGYGRTVGEALVTSKNSDLVTMTGSVQAGKEIYAAGAGSLKVIRLELGGKAPFVVLADADVDAAVEAAIVSRFTNCGQICTCNERMYLDRKIADEFLDKFLDKVSRLTLGNPLENPGMGPKISAAEVAKVDDLVKEAQGAGAEVLVGGSRPDGERFQKGHWYLPTVIDKVGNDWPIMQKEIFGPVVPIMRVEDFEHAMDLANQTDYGLSAYVYTNDLRKLMRLASTLKFGELYVNRPCGELVQGFHTGWNQSGLGGEDGKYGFDGYMRKQTTYVNWS